MTIEIEDLPVPLREMSDEVLLLKEIVAITRLSRSTIYSYIEQGDFPPQIKLGKRRVAWSKNHIKEWMERKGFSSSISISPQKKIPEKPPKQHMQNRKTLRDEFAMQVINGLCANPYFNARYDDSLAEVAYKQADAMLAEREKEPNRD